MAMPRAYGPCWGDVSWPLPQVEQIRRLVLEHEGVEYAHERASSYAQAAKADLEAFPPSEEREILALIADFVVNRDR